jgi:hemerythrin-like domain-containing protein
VIEPQSALGILMTEHRLIDRVVADVTLELEQIERGERAIAPEYIDTVVDFIRSYADRCHHGKEENILFLELLTKPLPEQVEDAMRMLVDDHIWARAKTGALVAATARYRAGDEGAAEDINDAITKLLHFYPIHIEKEEKSFFKMAIEQFTADEREVMLGRFRAFERLMPIREKYLGVVQDLEARRA